MDDINKLTLTIFLSVEQVNVLLALLGEQPLKNVVDLFNSLKMQGDRGVQNAAERAKQDEEARKAKENSNGLDGPLIDQPAALPGPIGRGSRT